MALVPDGEAVGVEFRPAGARARNIVQVRILAVMRSSPGEYMSTAAVQDAVAKDGREPPVGTRAIQNHLVLLAEEGLIDRMGVPPGQQEYWRVAEGPDPGQS